ncbi:hypothetical protein [Streptomyces noursei]|uniref:hypothetical protein n=1 Tax=Streptomyces noursei TaxID=1971 RepID=UPI001963D563|nr:hypothetical protein [Streptomyces noursei]QRX91186.1 hypothetical protein JNO44_10405 [Streptomyces noursei]
MVQAVDIDQLDGGVVLCPVAQFVGEARAAEALESGVLGGGAACGEEITNVLEAVQEAEPHDVVPFRFADGEQCVAAGAGVAVGRDVDFVAGPGRGVVDGAAGDAGGLAAVGFGGGVPAGPCPADLFGVGADDLAAEGGLGAAPYGAGSSWTFQVPQTGRMTAW